MSEIFFVFRIFLEIQVGRIGEPKNFLMVP